MHWNDSSGCKCAHCRTTFALRHMSPTHSTWVTARCNLPIQTLSENSNLHSISWMKASFGRTNKWQCSWRCLMIDCWLEQTWKQVATSVLHHTYLYVFFWPVNQEKRKKKSTRIKCKNMYIQKSKVALGLRWLQVSSPLSNLPRAFTLKSLPTPITIIAKKIIK